MWGLPEAGDILGGQPARKHGPTERNNRKELNSADNLDDQEPDLLLEPPEETQSVGALISAW